jgi:hypothetical protein
LQRTTDAEVAARELLGTLRGAVGAVVIDEDDFPGSAAGCVCYILDHRTEVSISLKVGTTIEISGGLGIGGNPSGTK